MVGAAAPFSTLVLLVSLAYGPRGPGWPPGLRFSPTLGSRSVLTLGSFLTLMSASAALPSALADFTARSYVTRGSGGDDVSVVDGATLARCRSRTKIRSYP